MSWQWRMIQKLKRNWLVVLKLTWTSQNLNRELEKSKKLFKKIGSLWPKYILLELQKYRGVIFHDTEELCKFWRKTDLWFEKRLEKFGSFLPEHLKVSKLGLWWDCKVITKWCKTYTKRTPDFKNHMRNLDNFSSGKVKKLEFNGLHLFKNYIP